MANGRVYNLKTIFSCVDHLSAHLKSIGESCKSVNNRMKIVSRSAGNVGRAFNGFAKRVAMPVTAAFSAIGLSVSAAAAAFTQYAGGLDATAQRIGVSVKALQELRYAADSNGSSAESMDRALGELNKVLANTAAGKNKDAALLFKTLGISIKDANGQVKSADKLMPELAESFRLNENQAVRTRMAIMLFGKSGTDLLPMLAQGGKALEEARKRADEFGLTVSDNAVAAGAELDQTLKDLKASATATVGEIGSKLVPIIVPLAQDLMRWVKANRELIATTVADWVKRIGAALASVDWNSVWSALKWFASAALAAEFAKVAFSVFQFGKALTAAFGPWGILVAAIVAAGTAIYLNWDRIVKAVTEGWESLKESIGELWGSIKDYCAEIVKGIQAMLPDWLQRLMGLKAGGLTVGGNINVNSGDAFKQGVLAPNPQALGLSASGAVSGRMVVDVRNSQTGESRRQVAPLHGGVSVSGNPGLIYGTD